MPQTLPGNAKAACGMSRHADLTLLLMRHYCTLGRLCLRQRVLVIEKISQLHARCRIGDGLRIPRASMLAPLHK
jgi:hypothetical protein